MEIASMSPAHPFDEPTLADAVATTGGELTAPDSGAPLPSLTTDSRTIGQGQGFVALRGEHFDGHDFVGKAVESGAALVIVDRDFDAASLPEGLPVLRVADTLKAWGALGRDRRQRWGGPVLALSGSNGKTTTRRLIASALESRYRVLEPVRNFNNLIGVPRTLLDLEPAHEVAVLELGMNQPGELEQLAWMADASAAMLTNIGTAHIGMFGSLGDLIEAKLQLPLGCAPGTPLVFNAGCTNSIGAMDRFEGRYPLTFFLGVHESVWGARPDVSIENIRPVEPVGYRFDLAHPGGVLTDLRLELLGRHHLENVAAAAALLCAGGFDPGLIAGALEGFRCEPLRGEYVDAGEFAMILDCYNASPPAMMGALRDLADTPCAGRRVLVLADMLELGAHSRLAHERMLEPLAALKPGPLFTLGPECGRLASMLASEGWVAEPFETREALTEALKASLKPGDVVFFKGSHGFALEKVAQAVAPGLDLLDTPT